MKISFIIPVYNVEPYLRKCVDSLLHQDYDNYEIILVDDGSTDGSGELADQLASLPTIRVIHQENRGLSGARNTGIAAAKGEYICFVDSDDYWEENVLGSLMAQIERDNLDVLRFNYQNVRILNNQYEVFEPNKNKHYIGACDEVLDGYAYLNTYMDSACYATQFILRRSLTIDCLFTPNIYFEDTDWTPRMLLKARRVADTDTVVYNYLLRQGSITQAVAESKKRKILDDKMRLVGALIRMKEGGRSGEWFDGMIAQTVVSIMGILARQYWGERDSYIGKLRNLHVFPLSSYMATPSGKRKIKLINISPTMYCAIMKMLRK